MRLFSVLFLLSACLTEESFPEQYAEATCERFERCEVDWEASAGGATCVDYQLLSMESETLAEGWTADSAQACIDYARDHDCDVTEAPEPHPCADIWD